MSLGPHITVERQLNDRDYYCRCTIDNTVFLAHVAPSYREEIAGEFPEGSGIPPAGEKRSCRFLRRNPDGEGMTCAVYESRPGVCRDFRCYRMLVRDREGKVCGKVIGKNTLRTEDTPLEKIWNEFVTAIPYGESAAWTQNVARILAAHGYCADPVE